MCRPLCLGRAREHDQGQNAHVRLHAQGRAQTFAGWRLRLSGGQQVLTGHHIWQSRRGHPRLAPPLTARKFQSSTFRRGRRLPILIPAKGSVWDSLSAVLHGGGLSRSSRYDPTPPSNLVSDMKPRWVRSGDGNVPGRTPPALIAGCWCDASRASEGPHTAPSRVPGNGGDLVSIHDV